MKETGQPKLARRVSPVNFEKRQIARTLIGEEVAQQILQLIGSGRLKPGDRIPAERELAQDFGVGRSSIREALRCLSIVGVLDARVGAGTTVARDSRQFLNRMWSWKIEMDPRDLEDLMQVRLLLEGATAEGAAAHASQSDTELLQDLITRMDGAQKISAKFMELDLEFHICLAKSAKNRLLSDLIMVLRTHMLRSMENVLPLPNVIALAHKEHKAILGAVVAHDGQRARARMEAHVRAALSRYAKSTKRN